MADRRFNTGEPLAYFITWTTYGTWLPGDQRGWLRRGDGNIHPPSKLFAKMAETDMKEAAFYLCQGDRDMVDHTIARHCDIRSCTLSALDRTTSTWS